MARGHPRAISRKSHHQKRIRDFRLLFPENTVPPLYQPFVPLEAQPDRVGAASNEKISDLRIFRQGIYD